MGKQSKLALFIAPFLLLGGYIASDYWLEYKAQQNRVFALEPVGTCELVNKKCVLSSGDLEVNVYEENGKTWVNATFALDSAVLFLVDEQNEATAYPLSMGDSPFYWNSETPLKSYLNKPGDSYKLRLIATIKGGRYIGEFVIRVI